MESIRLIVRKGGHAGRVVLCCVVSCYIVLVVCRVSCRVIV